MKKFLFLTCVLVALTAHSALSQITFTASPASQGPINSGDMFNVQIRLTIVQGTSPSNVAGFDLVFEALAMQNGVNTDNLFSVVAASTPIPNFSLIGFLPSTLTATDSNRAGYVQNDSNMGFSAQNGMTQSFATPVNSLLIATYTFMVDSATPAGTYNFDTTQIATSPIKYSGVSDSSGTSYPANNSATFSITVVPEPSTWATFGFGAAILVALNVLHRRRKA